MKIAVIGSKNIYIADIGKYISDCEEIVSGRCCGRGFLCRRICEKKGDQAYGVSARV